MTLNSFTLSTITLYAYTDILSIWDCEICDGCVKDKFEKYTYHAHDGSRKYLFMKNVASSDLNIYIFLNE